MRFYPRIFYFLVVSLLSLQGNQSDRVKSSPKEPIQVVEDSLVKLFDKIEHASASQDFLQVLNELESLDIEKLKNPLDFLANLLQTSLLRNAPEAIKAHYTHQLYLISIHIFYSYMKKKQYVSSSEKKKLIQMLQLIGQEANKYKEKAIFYNIAYTIAFVQVLPESELSLIDIAPLYRLTTILIHPHGISERELDLTLQNYLATEQRYIPTYLVILELFKLHFPNKANDQEAFYPLIHLLTTTHLSNLVRYRAQQILSEIFHSLPPTYTENSDLHLQIDEIQTILEETQKLRKEFTSLKHLHEMQDKRWEALQTAIQGKSLTSNSQIPLTYFEDYSWLYPPYIWLITLGLFFILLLVMVQFLINAIRRRRERSKATSS